MKITDLIHCLRQENGSSYAAGLMQQAADLIERQAAEIERLRAQVDYMEQVAAGLREEMDKAESEARRLRAENTALREVVRQVRDHGAVSILSPMCSCLTKTPDPKFHKPECPVSLNLAARGE